MQLTLFVARVSAETDAKKEDWLSVLQEPKMFQINFSKLMVPEIWQNVVWKIIAKDRNE